MKNIISLALVYKSKRFFLHFFFKSKCTWICSERSRANYLREASFFSHKNPFSTFICNPFLFHDNNNNNDDGNIKKITVCYFILEKLNRFFLLYSQFVYTICFYVSSLWTEIVFFLLFISFVYFIFITIITVYLTKTIFSVVKTRNVK